ncbi:MAG: hypothetical protein D6766_02140 [Verrucomicrobia bacterium]|nr:MAG: hypothetical protein D6766_02140 [Verrucomicrobiota bacterium]
MTEQATSWTPPQEQAAGALIRLHGAPAGALRFVWSPYRICPLGAHIDHQLGTVTALAIDRGTWLAFWPWDRPEVAVSRLGHEGQVRLRVDEPPPPARGDWGDYLRGAVQALQQSGWRLRRGFAGVTSGELTEAGLSSSASVGLAYLLALETVNGLEVAPEDNVRLDQAIENGYLGLRNGILDQSAILFSRRRHLTVIDCRRFEAGGGAAAAVRRVPAPSGVEQPRWLVALSGVTRAILATGYNQRVAECEAAARVLLEAAGRRAERPRLGLVTPEEYARWADRLAGAPARRARHFFEEMRRVAEGVEAWAAGDWARFGRLMTESGRSSIENYECGSEPLIDLYRLLVATPGVLGARFSGAGFRGCCVALVEPERAEATAREVMAAYRQRQPAWAERAGHVIVEAADGACVQ